MAFHDFQYGNDFAWSQTERIAVSQKKSVNFRSEMQGNGGGPGFNIAERPSLEINALVHSAEAATVAGTASGNLNYHAPGFCRRSEQGLKITGPDQWAVNFVSMGKNRWHETTSGKKIKITCHFD
jgi:hypothetical protein